MPLYPHFRPFGAPALLCIGPKGPVAPRTLHTANLAPGRSHCCHAKDLMQGRADAQHSGCHDQFRSRCTKSPHAAMDMPVSACRLDLASVCLPAYVRPPRQLCFRKSAWTTCYAHQQVKAVAAYIQRRAAEGGARLQYEPARVVSVRGAGMGDR